MAKGASIQRLEDIMLTVVIAIALQIPHFGLMAVSAHPDFSGTWKIDRKLSTYELLRDLEDLVFIQSFVNGVARRYEPICRSLIRSIVPGATPLSVDTLQKEGLMLSRVMA